MKESPILRESALLRESVISHQTSPFPNGYIDNNLDPEAFYEIYNEDPEIRNSFRHIVVPNRISKNEQGEMHKMLTRSMTTKKTLATMNSILVINNNSEIEEYSKNRKRRSVQGLKEADFNKYCSPKDIDHKRVANMCGRIKLRQERFIVENADFKSATKKILERILSDKKWLMARLLLIIDDSKLEGFLRDMLTQMNLYVLLRDDKSACGVILDYRKIAWRHYKRAEELTEEMLKLNDYSTFKEDYKRWEYDIVKRVFF